MARRQHGQGHRGCAEGRAQHQRRCSCVRRPEGLAATLREEAQGRPTRHPFSTVSCWPATRPRPMGECLRGAAGRAGGARFSINKEGNKYCHYVLFGQCKNRASIQARWTSPQMVAGILQATSTGLAAEAREPVARAQVVLQRGGRARLLRQVGGVLRAPPRPQRVRHLEHGRVRP